MTQTTIIELPLCENDLHSDFSGHNQIINFYLRAKQYRDTKIKVSFADVNWIDANMVALISGLLHSLSQHNNLSFIANRDEVSSKFDVLIRNGFISSNGLRKIDSKNTTLPLMQFGKDDKKGFINYIDQNLLPHRGMPNLDTILKAQIKDDLIELMSNVNYHANTDEPFFVCGQYYPKIHCLKLTMVDLGEGFLPKIKQTTGGKISTDREAIDWALGGRTTKPPADRVPGGLGIKNIYSYCQKHGGFFSIATGNAYWSTDLQKTPLGGFRHFQQPFTGTTINLHFKAG